jgi:CspA family cold shock protein
MSTSTDKATSERFTGRVKWFNNKAGYGFITVTDGSRSGSDIFVHHSVIGVGSQQFRYLVQGEYVEFDLVPTTKGSTHDIQASNVCGIKGGKLMCETRNEYKSVAKPVTSSASGSPSAPSSASATVKMPRQKSLTSDKEWTKVGRKPQSKK